MKLSPVLGLVAQIPLQADFTGVPGSFLTAVVKLMSTGGLHLGNYGLVLFVRKQI